MAHLLILTTLDVLGRRNNREHHVIAKLGPRFDKVTVVFRRRGDPGKRLRELLTGQVQVTRMGQVTYVAVDPVLNPPEGTLRNFVERRPGPMRQAVGAILDSAAILRDGLTVRALTRAARAAISNDMPVICEAFGPWAASAANSLRREGRITRAVYVDRDYEPGFMKSRLRRAWAERVEARAASSADLTLSIGHRLAARLAGIPGANVQISPTGVDGAGFVASLRETPSPHLVFIGQVAPWSGIEEVLEAMHLLVRDVADLRLTVLGPIEDGYRRALEPRIATLSARIDWRGDCPRDQVGPAIAAAGIGLATFRPHPLRIHAAPLKLMEYLASGLPVIALEGSEAGDIVSQARAGLTCATTGSAIAATIRRLLSDPAAYARMSAAGPVVAARHEWGVVLDREYDLLAELWKSDLQGAMA